LGARAASRALGDLLLLLAGLGGVLLALAADAGVLALAADQLVVGLAAVEDVLAWGAAPPTGSRIPQRPFEVVVHHTVYPTLPRAATKKQESARLRGIQRQHQAQGWIDIGYHLIIFPSGRVYRGRPLKTVGAHVESHNTGRVGIAFDGNFQTSTPTRAAIDTLVWLVRHRVLRRMRVVGHRDFGGTACPGDNLYPITKKL
jgi:N-acetylmuramoyl-L-alanine amidase